MWGKIVRRQSGRRKTEGGEVNGDGEGGQSVEMRWGDDRDAVATRADERAAGTLLLSLPTRVTSPYVRTRTRNTSHTTRQSLVRQLMHV